MYFRLLVFFAAIATVPFDVKAEPTLDDLSDKKWAIQKTKDRFSDAVEIDAIKVFPVQNGGKIVAAVKCSNVFQLEFDYYAEGDAGSGDNKKSSFDLANVSSTYQNLFPVLYRIDSLPSGQLLGTLKYRNQILLDLVNFMGGTEVAVKFVKANTVLMRLSVLGGVEADIEIHPQELREVFDNCQMGKVLLGATSSNNQEQREEARRREMQIPSMFGGGNYQIQESTAEKMIREAKEHSAPTPSTTQAIPSINCNSSRKTTIDLLVCSSPTLLKADAQLSNVYQNLLQTLDKTAATSLKRSQKQWLAQRAAQCRMKIGDIDEQESSRLVMCLQRFYDQRVSEFNSQLY